MIICKYVRVQQKKCKLVTSKQREGEREISTFHFDAISVSKIECIISDLSLYLVSLSVSVDKYNINSESKTRRSEVHKLINDWLKNGLHFIRGFGILPFILTMLQI